MRFSGPARRYGRGSRRKIDERPPAAEVTTVENHVSTLLSAVSQDLSAFSLWLDTCSIHYFNGPTLTTTAASGMRARMESLDMLANNISNSETGGYKTDREFLQSVHLGGCPGPGR